MKRNKFIAASLLAASIISTQFTQAESAASGVKEVGDIVTDTSFVGISKEAKYMIEHGHFYVWRMMWEPLINNYNIKDRKNIRPELERDNLDKMEKVADTWQSVYALHQLAIYNMAKATVTEEYFNKRDNPDRKEAIRIWEKCFNLSPTRCDNTVQIFSYYENLDDTAKAVHWLEQGSSKSNNGFSSLLLAKGILEDKSGFPKDKKKGLELARLAKQQLAARGVTKYDQDVNYILSKFDK
ncbi:MULTISPECIES: hypothetical protein [Acinetobacter]|uniref:Sel1 repeat family protein n=1 Tax=Acinetobacter indicus TaxID=756892 RepID=A0A6C0Y7M1_9GAMM|nr:MULTISPECIES: hypothetical protein [Acinetobacter]QIC72100.1 hypothetical protein FSC09_17225 [Acinetobacter indicus]QKQ71499.1 hypothetical protein E5Y90_14805 [Acinetobacter sp. 10FS3-1]